MDYTLHVNLYHLLYILQIAKNNGAYDTAGFKGINFSKINTTIGTDSRSTGLSSGAQAGIAIAIVGALIVTVIVISVVVIL